MGNSKGMPTTLTREVTFNHRCFLASFHTYYFESLLSGANYSNYAHFLLFHFPFLISLNTHQSPERSGRVYESLFRTQFFSVLCNPWNSPSGEKSQSHIPNSRIGKSQFSETSVVKQLLLKCSSYKFCFSFCCCFFISGFVRSADSEEKPVKQFRYGGFQPSLWYTLNG